MCEKIITPAWKCKWCGKKFFVYPTCVHHELICRSNPAMKHPCFECQHLHRLSAEFYTDTPSGAEQIARTTTFYCDAKKIGLYSHKVAVNKSHPVYTIGEMYAVRLDPSPSGVYGTTPDFNEFSHEEMPLHCEPFNEDEWRR